MCECECVCGGEICIGVQVAETMRWNEAVRGV